MMSGKTSWAHRWAAAGDRGRSSPGARAIVVAPGADNRRPGGGPRADHDPACVTLRTLAPTLSTVTHDLPLPRTSATHPAERYDPLHWRRSAVESYPPHEKTSATTTGRDRYRRCTAGVVPQCRGRLRSSFFPEQGRWQAGTRRVSLREIHSDHGHDGFPTEHDQLTVSSTSSTSARPRNLLSPDRHLSAARRPGSSTTPGRPRYADPP